MLCYIKKTGQEMHEIDINDSDYNLYLGEGFEKFYINDDFKNKNIFTYYNPHAKELNLEPNIFVVNNKDEYPCTKVLSGNVLFSKDCNLTDDEIKFIEDYINYANMNDKEKAMIGLYDYDPKMVGFKFNKKTK
jgi:hypothetical protein